MKHYNLIYILIVFLSIVYFGCDKTDTTIDEEITGQPITVNIVIAPEQDATTRWSDSNAIDSEMMYNWTVIVTDTNNRIELITTSSYTTGVKEIDYVENLSLTSGTKRFYTFANIALSTVTSSTPTIGNTL